MRGARTVYRSLRAIGVSPLRSALRTAFYLALTRRQTLLTLATVALFLVLQALLGTGWLAWIAALIGAELLYLIGTRLFRRLP